MFNSHSIHKKMLSLRCFYLFSVEGEEGVMLSLSKSLSLNPPKKQFSQKNKWFSLVTFTIPLQRQGTGRSRSCIHYVSSYLGAVILYTQGIKSSAKESVYQSKHLPLRYRSSVDENKRFHVVVLLVYTSSASSERNESFIQLLCQDIQSSTLFHRSQYGSNAFCTSTSISYSVASFENNLEIRTAVAHGGGEDVRER